MITKLNLTLENLLFFILRKIDSKAIISFVIFLSPFTYGFTPVLSYSYQNVYLVFDLLLFSILFKKIINTGKILKYNFLVPSLIFVFSFFISMFFGLPYAELTEYTVYSSSFNSVLIEISKTIPILFFAIYLIYIDIDSISEIFFYIKVMVISAVVVNLFSLYYLFAEFSGRLGGVFVDSNYLGRFEIIIISILILYISYTEKIWKKVLSIFFILFSFYLLIFTYSRSSFITFAIVAFIILMKRSKNKVYSILIFLGLLTLLALVFMYISTQRTGSLNLTDSVFLNTMVLEGSNFTRIILNIAGFNMFLDHPFFGIGFRNFYNVYLNYSYIPFGLPNLAIHVSIIHSWFFSVLAEQGLMGILPICYIIFLIFRYFKKLDNKLQIQKLVFVHRCLYILFIILIVNGLFFPHFFFETFFTILMGLIFGYFKVRELEFKKSYSV